jgi:hypothetical protein
MLFSIGRVERANRASAYFIDGMQLIAAPLTYVLVVWRLRESHRALLPWWGWVLICLAVGVRFVRLELRRDAPRTVFVRNYWFGFLPGRTHVKPFKWVGSGTTSDDVTNADALELYSAPFESETIWCYRPERIAGWVNEQQVRLGGGLPVARTIDR